MTDVLAQVRRLSREARVALEESRTERDATLAVVLRTDARLLIDQANELIDRNWLRVVHHKHGPGRVLSVAADGWIVIAADDPAVGEVAAAADEIVEEE